MNQQTQTASIPEPKVEDAFRKFYNFLNRYSLKPATVNLTIEAGQVQKGSGDFQNGIGFSKHRKLIEKEYQSKLCAKDFRFYGSTLVLDTNTFKIVRHEQNTN